MLDVIGAGFGRTGTHSLGQALEILGFGPCYHTLAVAQNPGHTEVWYAAMDGEAVDWDALFAVYRSTVEWPAAGFLPQLVRHFLQAKVILTERDADSWYESANATIFDGLELSAFNPDPVKRERSGVNRRLILERTFHGRHREKDYAVNVYRQHQAMVTELVPSERLLQFDVRAGWEPLCRFLDRPVPSDPFPRVNVRADFMASQPDWAKKIRRGESDPSKNAGE